MSDLSPLFAILLALAGTLTVAAIAWLIGYATGYQTGKRQVSGVTVPYRAAYHPTVPKVPPPPDPPPPDDDPGSPIRF